jgi:glycosyltransferase involved in cell wall biosynthesis
MLKIAVIGPLPPPFGGMANQTQQLARLLRADGIAVEIVQVNPPYFPRWVGAIKGLRAIVRLMAYLPQLWHAAGEATLFHVMANSGWSWHLFASPAVWIARMRRCRVIINYRGGDARKFFARSFFCVKWTLDRADAIVVPSDFLQAVFKDRGVAVNIVPNIIDLERFSPRKRASAIQAPHLIVTRNLEPIYDVGTAIRAFLIVQRRFPAAKLSIAGSGPQERNLKALVAQLKLEGRVEFLGRLDNELIAELYSRADIMLNASLVDNMPISILESLASGVPVVSTSAGGIPHLVEHDKNALLVPPGDFEAMAQAAISVLEDSCKTSLLVARGLEVAQTHSWASVRAKWLEMYASVAGSVVVAGTMAANDV